MEWLFICVEKNVEWIARRKKEKDRERVREERYITFLRPVSPFVLCLTIISFSLPLSLSLSLSLSLPTE